MYSLSDLVFGKACLNWKLSSLAIKQFQNNKKREEWVQYIIQFFSFSILVC
jgi:hypothetical protein